MDTAYLVSDNGSKLIDVIVPVLAALLGVGLGYLLQWLSQRGKIRIFLNDFKYTYLTKGSSGAYEEVRDFSQSQKTEVYFDIDFYNSSSKEKIVRKTLVYYKYRKMKIDAHFTDLEHNQWGAPQWIRSFSVAPKSIVNKRISLSIENLNFDHTKCEYYLQYVNNKNKLVIKKLNISLFLNTAENG